ncbi:nuclear transport factor 2 family protein [Pedobacter sp. HDW13]|uniref:nuclear transport factor 2 family protein n=1 Tax=unclassified Pedobacter TaxID=2628915 RepID=UPI000F5AF469|nr:MULTISPECIES: nuclear transport factor 2 family protein [unclassified Pedobacter]QIL40092.1 nuclear transport factor 2 family protein [Pedobacter sp. HDW13]RQO68337.1 cysteinyl-tRNA synthetase [Pedobacter sp. KBW01]
MKQIFSTAIASLLALSTFAQKSDGTTKSLVSAEKDFAKAVAKNGDKDAFLEYSLGSALVFRPNPINAKTFYTNKANSENDVSWTPNLAKVSRSGDLGFTTGPYEVGAADKKYGQYLSIWKSENGKWKLAIDLGTESNKPLAKVTPQFVEPKDHVAPKFLNEKEVKAGKEIILTTEKTLNTLLKTHGIAAFGGFLTNDARLLFPGNEAIEGKGKIVAFYNSMVSKISLKTTGVDKAIGSDLAYTYGVATIDYKADLRESFNYVFVYEKAADASWNLIVQAFVPAER